MPRHSGSGGKWFKKSSGVKPVRHGKGRGKSRGLKTQVAAPTPPVRAAQPKKVAGAQPPAAGQPQRRRTRARRRSHQK